MGLAVADPIRPGTFLEKPGVYPVTNTNHSATLTVGSGELKLAASQGANRSAAGANSWRTGRGWFAYVAKDLRVWAYDGEQTLWLLEATPLDARAIHLHGIQERPPAEVVKRLPRAVAKRLPRNP